MLEDPVRVDTGYIRPVVGMVQGEGTHFLLSAVTFLSGYLPLHSRV